MSEISTNTFEAALAQRMFQSANSEKTFIDKLFSREDAVRIRQLMRKNDLTREDLLELLNLISGVEAKLVNYGEWDRYIVLKFFIWIREFIKINMMLFDYKDEIEKNKIIILSDRSKRILQNNIKLMEHNTKFLVDLYLNISRTTLSLGATGFLEVLKNKFELDYNPVKNPLPQNDKKGFFGFLKD